MQAQKLRHHHVRNVVFKTQSALSRGPRFRMVASYLENLLTSCLVIFRRPGRLGSEVFADTGRSTGSIQTVKAASRAGSWHPLQRHDLLSSPAARPHLFRGKSDGFARFSHTRVSSAREPQAPSLCPCSSPSLSSTSESPRPRHLFLSK